NAGESVIATIAHEVVEAITNPDPKHGWYLSHDQEVADPCEWCATTLYGGGWYAVDGYYSVARQRGVIPQGWETGPSNGGQARSGSAHQTARGPYDFAETTTDTREVRAGGVIGARVSMLAVGADGIYALPPDQSFVARYRVGEGWSIIGAAA